MSWQKRRSSAWRILFIFVLLFGSTSILFGLRKTLPFVWILPVVATGYAMFSAAILLLEARARKQQRVQ